MKSLLLVFICILSFARIKQENIYYNYSVFLDNKRDKKILIIKKELDMPFSYHKYTILEYSCKKRKIKSEIPVVEDKLLKNIKKQGLYLLYKEVLEDKLNMLTKFYTEKGYQKALKFSSPTLEFTKTINRITKFKVKIKNLKKFFKVRIVVWHKGKKHYISKTVKYKKFFESKKFYHYLFPKRIKEVYLNTSCRTFVVILKTKDTPRWDRPSVDYLLFFKY